jgi:tetratricopeptide (TPR) repeat protein
MTTQPGSVEQSVPAAGRPVRGRTWLAAIAIAGLAAIVLAGWWQNFVRPENCYCRGRLALTAGDRQTVIREARRLLGKPGFEAHSRLLSGLLFLRERRHAAALNELQHAARDRRTDVAALTAAAECYYLLGKYVQAVNAARAAVERDAEALDARRWLVAAYYDLGAHLHGRQKFAEAFTHFQRAFELKPANNALRQNLAAELVNIGTELASQNQVIAASDYFRRALMLAPGHLDANYRLARALAQNRQNQEAAEYFEKSSVLGPEIHEMHFEFALVLRELGLHDKAVRHLQEAVHLRPDFEAAITELRKSQRFPRRATP